jgi:hypothetical protein
MSNINIPTQVSPFASFSQFPAIGKSRVIYIDQTTNISYYWNVGSSSYVSLGGGTSSVEWGDITGTLADQTDLQNALDDKVDKETGKGLSTNDYTTAEKDKLAGIESGAQVNVNADWNATTGDAEILNKPTIPSVAGLVPYTGATTDVDLGTHSLTARKIIVNHPSGSGDAATITKGGAGEALKVVKTSGSGNAASITGGVTLLDELHLTTDLADSYISSAATWNNKVPQTRTITINGTTQDLSADRTFTISNPTLDQVTTAGNTTANQITIGGATTNGSVTASGAIARGNFFNNTLVASANGDVLSSLDVLTTYTPGAFTGVQNYGLRLITANPTPLSNSINSPIFLTQGGIWNSASGPRTMSGGMLVSAATYPIAGFNINPTISKLSFIVGSDNALATEVMFVNSNGKMGVNGGMVGLAPNTNNIYNITLENNAAATSAITFNSNKLVLKGKAWNSAQGSMPSMGYLMVSNVQNNTNPTIDKLSLFVGSANSANQGETNGNATERLALRTDGIFSFLNSSTTETLRLFNTGNLLVQTGGTFTDAGFKLDVQGVVRHSGSIGAFAGVARGTFISSTLVATANNDVLVGLDIAPAFTTGAFTGVQQEHLVIRGNNNPIIRFKNQTATTTWGQVGANSAELFFNAQAGSLNFFAGNTSAMYVFSSTRNVVLQNGGTFTDEASSRLTVNSTTQGVLFPRMTTTQKNAIASPATGLMVFDTTLNKLCVRGAASWETITSL